MNEVELRESLLALFPPEDRLDWDDVIRRSGQARLPRRRLTLVLAFALFVTLAVGSALALSGRLGSLFHGASVNVTPLERFQLRQFDANGKVKLLARRDGLAFYVIRRRDGRLCYLIGDVRAHLTPAQRARRFRFGGGGCVDPRIFPTRADPVLDQSYYSYSAGDPAARLAALRGFAADPVARIGVIGPGNQIIFTVDVKDNVYTAGRQGFIGARGIVALDDEGKVLWVQCTAIGHGVAPQFPSGGCGKYKNSLPPRLPPLKLPRRPIEAPGPLVVQHGAAAGVRFDIRGSRIAASFDQISRATRALLVSRTGKITLGCFKLMRVANQTVTSSEYVSKPFASVVRFRPYNPIGPPATRPPYDACTVSGMYGHTWNDTHGTHDTVEISLTPRGRAYLADRAVARDIAWLARARVFHPIRYDLKPFSSVSAARSLGKHVVSLPNPTATPPLGRLGIWIGPSRRIVLAERTPTGRRLYLELRRGVQYRTNLLGLTQVI
jgi:hypothetical protein